MPRSISLGGFKNQNPVFPLPFLFIRISPKVYALKSLFLKSCAIRTCKLLITSPLKWKVTGRLKDTSRLDLGKCFFNKCQWNEGEKAAWAHVITGNKADNGEIATQPNKHSDALVGALLRGEWCALRPSPLLGYVPG